MSRKGIGTLFVWIFIVIVGGLILLMFFLVAQGQVQAGKSNLDFEALQQVTTIIATQQTSPDTYAQVPIPNDKITLQCELIPPKTILSQINIGGQGQDMTHLLVAGRNITTGQLVLFNKELWLPFSVGNVLFLTDDKEMLVLQDAANVHDASQALIAFNESIPSAVDRRVDPTGSAIPNAADYQNTRVVLFDPPQDVKTLSQFDVLDGAKAQLMVVRPSTTDWRQAGTITFYKPDPTPPPGTPDAVLPVNPPIPYVGETMLLAFIWQGDRDSASCLQAKIADRISLESTLQMERYGILYQQAKNVQDTACYGAYTTGALKNLRDVGGDTSKWAGANGIADAVNLVAAQNQNVLRGGGSCATIY